MTKTDWFLIIGSILAIVVVASPFFYILSETVLVDSIGVEGADNSSEYYEHNYEKQNFHFDDIEHCSVRVDELQCWIHINETLPNTLLVYIEIFDANKTLVLFKGSTLNKNQTEDDWILSDLNLTYFKVDMKEQSK